MRSNFKPPVSAPNFPSIPLHLANVTIQKEINNEKIFEFQKNAKVEAAIYLRSPTKLIGNTDESTGESIEKDVVQLSWVTISQTQIEMENINFKGLIQVTARGKLRAVNCSFIPNNNASECAVEIFAQSKGEFINCKFTDAQKAALLVRDRSDVILKNCTFEKNSYSSLLLLDSSHATLDNCTFTDAQRFSVYVYRRSMAEFDNCHFHDHNKGKSVFILFGGQTTFKGCRFNKCNGGAVSMAESSSTVVENCSFEDINLSALHGMKDCTLKVSNSNFKNCKGNGVNFEHSTGEVSNCTFDNFDFPVFAVFGPKATPIISKCIVTQPNSFGAVSRDLAAPTFMDIHFSKGKNHCFSISDFSNAEIKECTIEDFQGAAFNVFNGAKAHIEYNTVSKCKYLSDTFTLGEAIITNNILLDSMNLRKRYLGKFIFENNMQNNHFVSLQEIDSESIPIDTTTEETEKQDETSASTEVKLAKTDDANEHIFTIVEDLSSSITAEDLKPKEFTEPKPFEIDELNSNQPELANTNPPPIKCMGCGQCDAEVVCSPCGHRVLCKQCAPQHKVCPLCSTIIQKVVNVYKSEQCLVCFDPIDTIILPCGHLNVCYACALQLWKDGGRKCPECREKMGSFRHIFPMLETK